MVNTHPVVRYRIRNWCAYNRALINRGRLTVWFDEQAIAAWRNTELASGPGAPRLYAEVAIECTLVLKSVFQVSLRATQGFLSSLVELMALALPIPHYSTVSRRQGVCEVVWCSATKNAFRKVFTAGYYLFFQENLHAVAMRRKGAGLSALEVEDGSRLSGFQRAHR
jgi:hypothetical protein